MHEAESGNLTAKYFIIKNELNPGHEDKLLIPKPTVYPNLFSVGAISLHDAVHSERKFFSGSPKSMENIGERGEGFGYTIYTNHIKCRETLEDGEEVILGGLLGSLKGRAHFFSRSKGFEKGTGWLETKQKIQINLKNRERIYLEDMLLDLDSQMT